MNKGIVWDCKTSGLIVGVRFPPDAPIRAGMGSMVIDARPVSGPVSVIVKATPRLYTVFCERCHNGATVKRSNLVLQWAHRHRCETNE